MPSGGRLYRTREITVHIGEDGARQMSRIVGGPAGVRVEQRVPTIHDT